MLGRVGSEACQKLDLEWPNPLISTNEIWREAAIRQFDLDFPASGDRNGDYLPAAARAINVLRVRFPQPKQPSCRETQSTGQASVGENRAGKEEKQEGHYFCPHFFSLHMFICFQSNYIPSITHQEINQSHSQAIDQVLQQAALVLAQVEGLKQRLSQTQTEHASSQVQAASQAQTDQEVIRTLQLHVERHQGLEEKLERTRSQWEQEKAHHHQTLLERNQARNDLINAETQAAHDVRQLKRDLQDADQQAINTLHAHLERQQEQEAKLERTRAQWKRFLTT